MLRYVTLHFHSGTDEGSYRWKRNNRKAETLYREAEISAGLGQISGITTSAHGDLMEGWKSDFIEPGGIEHAPF